MKTAADEHTLAPTGGHQPPGKAAVADTAAPEPADAIGTALGVIERAAAALPVIAVLLVVGMLWWAQVLLIPVVLSVLASYALEPVVTRLERWHVRRVLAVPIVMLALMSLLSVTVYALSSEATAFINKVPTVAHTLSQAIHSAAKPGPVSKVQQAAQELEAATREAAARPAEGVTPVRVEQPTFNFSAWLVTGSRTIAEFVAQMLGVLFLTYYLLVAGDLYRRKLVRIVPTFSDKRVTVEILVEIDKQIERFILARVTLSAIIGAMVWLAFRVIGLENAGVWAVLSAVLFTIPVLGPAVVIVAATIAAFVQFGSMGMTAAVAGLGLAIGAIEGNVLTPWLMSRAGRMNAVAVFVSLMFWGWVWGIWGLLLAVPITAAIKSVCERVPHFSAFAELLKE